MTSESLNFEPPNVLFIYNEETKADIPFSVTHMRVDSSVKEIHDYAFQHCFSLVEVEFSEGLEVIGTHAFYNCTNLKHKNKLPSTLKEIGDHAFFRCKSVLFIYNTSGAIPLGVTHMRVDSSAKEIHGYAFQHCFSLVEVEFSEGLEVIGTHAFCECTNLKHKNKLPSTLKEIGDHAFFRCKSLDSIEFPEGLQVIGENAFYRCWNLERIKIPSAHVVIEESAFSHCIRLISVELPEGLQVIGKGWFTMCTSLATVNVPSSVNEIQEHAFSYCTSLASLDLPEGLQSIGAASFNNCGSLVTLHIPSTVRKIGKHAFSRCFRLRSITLPETLETIEESVFRDCHSLRHVRIPSSVTRIEQAAFTDCDELISLELPEGLEMIDIDGVYGCRSLVNLVLPSKQHYDQELLMESSMLYFVASASIDLVSKLQHRFDDLPVHRLCYYQSYYPVTEAMENLRQVMYEDPSTGTKIDSLGMTPFHILALSQTPNLSLFQALLKVYKVDIIRTRDKFGSTPIDYLCLNHSSDSAMVIQSLLQTTIVAQRLRWLGLARWKSDILAAMDEALAVEWSSRRREILLLYYKLATYERLESISLLELALWKVKIDEEGSPDKLGLVELDLSQEERADRQSCRIYSGADAVISNVLPFLDKVCRKDYYVED